MPVLEVNDKNFEAAVLRSALPVLVDLYADWCEPCKQIAPLVAELADTYEGKLNVVKVDTEKSPMIAQAFRVQSIPMLIVMKDGQVAGHHVGALDRKGLLELVAPVLPADPDAAAQVKPGELAQLLAAQRAVPVDIRDEGSFKRYRIPGAVHVDATLVPARAKELAPTDGRVRILYGRSTDEAKDLVKVLGEQGVQAGFLEGGFLHWEADGLEVERG